MSNREMTFWFRLGQSIAEVCGVVLMVALFYGVSHFTKSGPPSAADILLGWGIYAFSRPFVGNSQ